MEASSKPVPVSHPRRQGTCRLCFEQGGDLIAPCACKGTSKWIHRDCLNRWRVAGANPMSLTNCCECGIQYHLDLHRIINTEGEQRQRQFIRRVASQGLLTFVAVQLAICSLGVLIRMLDKEQMLVSYMNLTDFKIWHPYDGVCRREADPSLQRSFRCHKSEYYMAGVCILFALVGLIAILIGFFSCIRSPRSSAASNVYCYYPCTDCCSACGEGCARACANPCDVSHCDCSACCGCGSCCDSGCCKCCECNDSGNSSNCKDCGPNSVSDVFVIFLVIVVALALIGLFVALVVIVGAIQKAMQHYARLQQIKVLAQEYVVRDLADPSDLGDENDTATLKNAAQETMIPPPNAEQALRPIDPETQQRLHVLISRDVSAIFNGPDPQQALRTQGVASPQHPLPPQPYIPPQPYMPSQQYMPNTYGSV